MFFVLTLAAALDGIFTLTDRTDTRLRDPDQITNRAAIDFDTILDARMVLRPRKDVYTLAYMPQLSFLDVNDVTRTTTFLNAGLAAAEWNWPHARLSFSEYASYGRQSFASLSASAPSGTSSGATGMPMMGPASGAQTPLLVPVAETFFFESSITHLTSTLRLRPWTLFATVGYQLSGGNGGPSQPMPATETTTTGAAASGATGLPLQKGPLGEASATFAATHRDDLITDARGADASFSNGPEDLLISLEEIWRHRWSHSTDTLLAAGAAVSRARPLPVDPYSVATYPVAEATINEHISRGKDQFLVRLDARLAPTINILIGSVDELIQGTLVANWTHRRFSLQALATAGETVDQATSTAYRAIQGELDLSYRVSEVLSFDGGARLLREAQDEIPSTTGAPLPATEVDFEQGLVFVAVTIRPIKAKF
jgi:hypothetical protein